MEYAKKMGTKMQLLWKKKNERRKRKGKMTDEE